MAVPEGGIVNILTTEDVGLGNTLTELYYNHLEMIDRLSEVSIINNSGFTITTTDCYGIVTNHSSKHVSEFVFDKTRLPLDFKGVVVIERKKMSPNDLISTSNYYNKYSNIVRYTTRVERIHTHLLNTINPNRIREYYVVYAIPEEVLRVYKNRFLRSPNLIISIPGYETRSPLMEDVNLDEVFINNNDDALGLSITYYSIESDTVYLNIMGIVIRVDSVSPSDDSDEGLVIHRSHDGIIDTQTINKSEFNTRYIYSSYKEAKYNMYNDDILATRKLDLEFLKTESAIITNTLTDSSTLYKIRMDLASKVITAIQERDKVIKLQKPQNTALDNIKKIVDIISMIKKIV
jgi:hypothetical protein